MYTISKFQQDAKDSVHHKMTQAITKPHVSNTRKPKQDQHPTETKLRNKSEHRP